MTSQYAYFIFRAISGICASATVPSALRLIPAVFDASELQLAFNLYGLAGVMANVTGQCLPWAKSHVLNSSGLVFAGLFGFITTHDQNAD